MALEQRFPSRGAMIPVEQNILGSRRRYLLANEFRSCISRRRLCRREKMASSTSVLKSLASPGSFVRQRVVQDDSVCKSGKRGAAMMSRVANDNIYR